MTTTPQARTVGLISRELGVPISRVTYILRTRPHIQPIGAAGNVRLFGSDAVAQIRYELNRIDARRDGGGR